MILAQGGERLSVSACVAPNKHCQRGLKQKTHTGQNASNPLCKNNINANAVE